MRKILFIGLGHMGEPLAKAIAQNNHGQWELYGRVRTKVTENKIKKSIPEIKFIDQLEDLEKEKIDTIILGVRPDDVEQLCHSLNHLKLEKKIIVSMVNALDLKTLANYFPDQKQLIFARIIPNINAALQKSVTALTTLNASPSQLNSLQELFTSCGTVEILPEKQFSAFTAIAGCLPAYLFTFFEALVDYAIKQGFSKSQATRIVNQAIIGSSATASQNSESLSKLISQVCVPNGATIEGQKILEDRKFSEILQKALAAAQNKA